MAPQQYLEAVRAILAHLETTQLPAVEQAATHVADALTGGGAVYCAGIGHGIQGDFINRAGGLAAVQAFTYSFHLSDKAPRCLADRPRPEPFERDLETVRFAVRAGNLRAGDVMLVGSVSGRNREPIELSLACRARGLKTIGLTAMAYTRQVTSLHPSGKRLCEAVDVAIDIGAPYGDAAVALSGYDIAVMPVSGVAMDVAGWMLFGRAMELMAARGKPATAFLSLNREGGDAYHRRAQEQYEQRGY